MPMQRAQMQASLQVSKSARQEGTRLKALELMGKSVGLFIDKTETEVKTVSAEQLKQELGQHLKLIKSKVA
jgi:flagellar basal body-associated protein FliL